jgi:NADH dehydrogenase FAD-containing subunit
MTNFAKTNPSKDTAPVTSPTSGKTSVSPLVLVGAGHAHLVALRRWTQGHWRAPQGSVMINPDTQAWYSGMMPGLIAGRFNPEDCTIPLDGLCQAAGIELLLDSVGGVGSQSRCVQLDSGRTLHYQCLSLNTGSVPPTIEDTDDSVPQLSVKPFQAFLGHWNRYRDSPGSKGIVVVGGGAAAFELAMALRQRLPLVPVTILCAQGLLESHGTSLRRRALAHLNRANIRTCEFTIAARIYQGNIFSHDDMLCHADVVVLATGAAALPWYQTTDLATDSRGFISVTTALQSVSDPEVFASGGCASLEDSLRSGVYSVRHGSVLAHNIPAWLSSKPLLHYQAQKKSLALLATADGGALVSYGRLTAQGRLAGIWKDYLDSAFMKRHRL